MSHGDPNVQMDHGSSPICLAEKALPMGICRPGAIPEGLKMWPEVAALWHVSSVCTLVFKAPAETLH
jgi:hypothetical protein